jgi:McbB family protein
MFKEINLRNHSSLHKLFYSLQLTDKGIIDFFNKLDQLHKNKVTEKFIENFFGSVQYESVVNFLLTSQLIEREKNIDSKYKRSVVFINSSKIYSSPIVKSN